MARNLLFWTLTILLLWGCSPSGRYYWYQPPPGTMEMRESSPRHMSRSNLNAADTLTYFFLSHLPHYELRVNVHVMQDEFGRHNFDQESGPPIIKQILADANLGLSHNQKMWLPKNNPTQVWPIGYQYVLTSTAEDDDGIYFHRDRDSLFYLINRGNSSNLTDERVFKKYAVGQDSILNIFVMANHPDSAHSATYVRTDNGIAFQSWVKVVNWYENMRDTSWSEATFTLPKGPWYCKNLLNHEVGHVLGLRHAWSNSDGCEDTPAHDNCWNFTSTGPCQELVSNNVMDYNTYQSAWTPCQIERIHHQFTNAHSLVRQLIRPYWHTLDTNYNITITDSMVWARPVDLAGHLILSPDATLVLRQTLNMPSLGEIQLMPGARLIIDQGGQIIHDGVGKWKGIKLMEKKRTAGTVTIHAEGRLLNMQNQPQNFNHQRP